MIATSVKLRNEPEHDKTHIITCAPHKDSDQPAHPRSLIRVFANALCIAKGPVLRLADSEDSDQTAQANTSLPGALMCFRRFCCAPVQIASYQRPFDVVEIH